MEADLGSSWVYAQSLDFVRSSFVGPAIDASYKVTQQDYAYRPFMVHVLERVANIGERHTKESFLEILDPLALAGIRSSLSSRKESFDSIEALAEALKVRLNTQRISILGGAGDVLYNALYRQNPQLPSSPIRDELETVSESSKTSPDSISNLIYRFNEVIAINLRSLNVKIINPRSSDLSREDEYRDSRRDVGLRHGSAIGGGRDTHAARPHQLPPRPRPTEPWGN